MSRRPTQRWLWVLMILVIIANAYLFTTAFLDKQAEADSAQTQVVDEKQQKDAIVDKADTLAQQVTTACAESKGRALRDLREAGLCKQARDTKETITKALDPSTPTPSTTGPSQSQVNAAVRLILSGIDVQGSPGVNGKRGPGPTMAQLAQAVVTFCSTSGEPCKGLKGDKGDSVTGPKGDTGSSGTNGKDAPTIQTATCDADDHIVFGLSDGTSVVVAGSDCRVDILPGPEPTE